MNSRFDFDETPLKKDFGSFSLDDISSGSSITSIIKSIFTAGARLTWNDVYKFAYNEDSTYCAILIGQQLFRVSISDGRQIFTNVGENYYDVAYLSKRDEIIVLSDKQITYYNNKLTSIKSIPNQNKLLRLAIINDNLVGISKSQITFIENTEEKPIAIEEWTYLSYCNRLICLGSKTISIINNEYNTIHPDIKYETIKEISCNSKGSKIYILDNKNNITILSEDSDYMEFVINETTGTMQVMPWKDEFYLTLNNYSTISFFNNNGQRVLSKNIKPNSVLRYVPSGFLMFDPQNVIGQNVHFDIVKFTPVDPYDLYTRSCENSMWSEAKKLQEIYNFDSDIFHKFYIQNNELNRRIIDEHLRLIKDKDYVYNFVLNNSSISSDIESALINECLRVKPNDEKLTKIRERLRIFTKLPRTSFLQSEWNEFKNSDIKVTLQNFAKNQKFKDIAIIFQESKEITKSDKDDIISHLSPFIPPSEYECLMPNDVEYFKKKCFEIDDKIGQTDILCQFLKIGSTKFPKELSELYNNSLLFDEFVCNATNLEAVKKLSFNDFINLQDEQKLFIFISDSNNGLEAKNIIEKHCLKICQNNFDGLCTLMSNILSDSPEMFKKSPETDRIKFVSQIIEIFPTKSDLADKILKYSTIILDDTNISVILSSFGYLSEVTKDLLILLKFNNKNSKPKSFKQITDKTIPEFILSAGENLLSSKNLTFDNWSEFTKTSKRVYKDYKKDTEFRNKLKMETFNAMLTLKEWSEIEITNSKEIDICLDFCQKMIKSAKSCSLRDENLSSAVQILGMIPDDMQPPIVKSLFNRFMMYDAFSELDNLITPSIIDTTEDKTKFDFEHFRKKR
ncbi:hypothetical protein TVAG_118170 [Trichomonas vaginalis G3]|uniref:Uncharacterized protein n=1 Tax=Trichomonas vaginalis (strain ATCC PRA-98 / G3) TaxID=412133 RepID=A2EI04_TRIV3|nr:hypothetical protein TVAG_118170 [Trichomonas vaginalis G3]|eukprot:XP_001319959.1 hypothetical protein [Trichomonas vaginalis G3]